MSKKQFRPETTSEHIARDIREGRFPEQSPVQMVPVEAPAHAEPVAHVDGRSYRKKPVVVKAVQWTGENLREVIAFTDGPPETKSHHAGMMWEQYEDLVRKNGLKIYTLEGKMDASPGDWIIKGVKGEFYPCKPDIFAATYDPANQPTAPVVPAEGLDALIAAAKAEAEKAMRKFPQPNYVISKVAEEAGEVVKAAIHCAEGRETQENVVSEIRQAMAMLFRLYLEGDQVHGLPPLRAQQPAAPVSGVTVQEAARVLLDAIGDYDRNRGHSDYDPSLPVGDALLSALAALLPAGEGE